MLFPCQARYQHLQGTIVRVVVSARPELESNMTSHVTRPRSPVSVASWSQLPDRPPQYALVAGVDLVVTPILMKVLARACGHDSLAKFQLADLTIWKRDLAHLTGVQYAGSAPPSSGLF